LVNGAVVKLRLLNDLYINGSLIPKGNFVFGIASLNGERLEVEINSIRYNQSLYPVKLEVYDIDGLPGIYIPGAITRDVAKQSVDNTLQLMELSTMDPSLKAQATAAGIGAAKTLLSKKVKQVKVMVKAGYKVLLRDKNIQQ
jgi:conjugative transposon TraM protein